MRKWSIVLLNRGWKMRRNILHAIENRDAQAFLSILDDGFMQAAKAASAASHDLGLDVVDGRGAIRRPSGETSADEAADPKRSLNGS